MCRVDRGAVVNQCVRRVVHHVHANGQTDAFTIVAGGQRATARDVLDAQVPACNDIDVTGCSSDRGICCNRGGGRGIDDINTGGASATGGTFTLFTLRGTTTSER